MLSVIVFLLPLITGIIAAFVNLKTDDETKSLFQRITFAGGVVFILSLAYISLGSYDLYKKDQRDTERDSTIQSLRTNTTYIKAQNDSYYQLLKAMGITLDTTQREAKHNIDSLLKIVSKQKTQLDLKHADFNFCTTESNMKVKEKNGDYIMNVDICNQSIPVQDVRLKYFFVVLRNGQFIIPTNSQTKQKVSWLMNLTTPIPTNSPLSQDVPIPYPLKSSDTTYFVTFGTYKDEAGKTYQMKTIYRMDDGKQFNLVNDNVVTDIKRFIKKEGYW